MTLHPAPQEYDVDQIKRTVQLFDQLKSQTVDAIVNGIRLFRDILEGNINIADIIQAFVDAIQNLPDKVSRRSSCSSRSSIFRVGGAGSSFDNCS